MTIYRNHGVLEKRHRKILDGKKHRKIQKHLNKSTSEIKKSEVQKTSRFCFKN